MDAPSPSNRGSPCSSTPTLFNSGTLHSQLSSCYLYKVDDSITLSYAVYAPQVRAAKSPLIIWLHGGGEGIAAARI